MFSILLHLNTFYKLTKYIRNTALQNTTVYFILFPGDALLCAEIRMNKLNANYSFISNSSYN